MAVVTPISETVLLVLTGVAFLGSYKVATIRDQQRVLLRVLGGAFLVVLWGAIAFWWTDYVVISDLCGCELARSNTPLSLVALIVGGVMLLDVFKSAFALVAE